MRAESNRQHLVHINTLALISLLTPSIKFQSFRCSVSCVDELVTIASCGCVHAPYLIDKDGSTCICRCRCVPSILCVTITYAEIVITYELNEPTTEWTSKRASERTEQWMWHDMQRANGKTMVKCCLYKVMSDLVLFTCWLMLDACNTFGCEHCSTWFRAYLQLILHWMDEWHRILCSLRSAWT